jgi:hypothetical protein
VKYIIVAMGKEIAWIMGNVNAEKASMVLIVNYPNLSMRIF